MGAREAGNEKASGWAKGAGPRASHGTFADAAAFAEIVFHCALGSAALDVLEAAGSKNLAGKILVDVSNPHGRRPLARCGKISLIVITRTGS
jgi:predicted dinucleotide-binding enzyme